MFHPSALLAFVAAAAPLALAQNPTHATKCSDTFLNLLVSNNQQKGVSQTIPLGTTK